MSTEEKRATQEAPPPVDVVDGIPDRTSRQAVWKYAVLALIFAAWVAVLISLLMT